MERRGLISKSQTNLSVFVRILYYISGMDTTHIYTLSHPLTGQIRYVGKANNLKPRLALHLWKDEQTAKSRWIQSLQKQGLQPVMELLDVVPRLDWQFWEMYWIAQLKAWGHTLYNGDNGGLGTDRLPDSVKAKISETIKGTKLPDRWKPYAQYDMQGNYIRTFPSLTEAEKTTNTNRANIIRVQGNGLQSGGYLWLKIESDPPLKINTRFDLDDRIIISDETRRAMSTAGMGKNVGRKASPETKLKQRIARLGKSPANKGIPKTPEQRQKDRETCPTRKAVRQLDMNGKLIQVWGSVKEASGATGASRLGIIRTISGRYKHAANFKWEFVQNPHSDW